jgi:hypothetical protein
MADPNKPWSQADKEAFSGVFSAEKAEKKGKKSPPALAGLLAQAFAADTAKAPAPAQEVSSPVPAVQPQMNAHMLKMKQAAEEARRRYMLDNGVDENGDPVR